MTALLAHDQPRLPLRTCARLVVAGIGFRLLRSGITVVIQAVAIAFLMFMAAGALIDHAVAEAADNRLRPYRAADELLTRLGAADSAERILEALRDPSPAQLAEFAAWARTDEATVRGATEELNRAGADAAAGPAAQALAEQVRRGHRDAARNLAAALPATSPAAWLADPPGGLLATLRAEGFAVTADQLDDARPYAARTATLLRLTEALQRPVFKQAIARRTGIPVSKVTPDTALSALGDLDDAAWMAGQLQAAGAAAPGPAVLLDAATHARDVWRYRAALEARADNGAPAVAGVPTRTVLLVTLALLVCVVGIANAMFMSVTERFGEIATMKCLGALNGSVMRMYLIEAMILGSVGGALGLVLGALLAAGYGFVEHGRLLAAAGASAAGLGWIAAAAWGLGLGLSVVAAIVPSLWASRLPPMAAMRVE